MRRTTPGDAANPSDALLQEAQVWLRALNADSVKAWEAEGFKRWLKTSPAHEAAFRMARERSVRMRSLAGEVLRTDPAAARRYRRHLQISPVRRTFLRAAAGAAVAATVAGVTIFHPPGDLWSPPDEWGADLQTAPGQQRTLSLAQGLVTLNTRSSMRNAPAGQLPGIDLLGGEAAIDLTGDSPFVVVAGAGRSQASASSFDVRYQDGQACVTCIQGSVRVEHPAGRRDLQAGQQMRYDGRTIGPVTRVAVEAVSAWRRGELVFNGTTLADVISEINRYRPGRVILMNDSVRGKPVTGSFYIASLEQALVQLRHTFGLQARALPGGMLLLT